MLNKLQLVSFSLYIFWLYNNREHCTFFLLSGKCLKISMIVAGTEGLEVSRVNVLLRLKPVASIILGLDFFHENGLKAVSSHRFSLKRDIRCKKIKMFRKFCFLCLDVCENVFEWGGSFLETLQRQKIIAWQQTTAINRLLRLFIERHWIERAENLGSTSVIDLNVRMDQLNLKQLSWWFHIFSAF